MTDIPAPSPQAFLSPPAAAELAAALPAPPRGHPFSFSGNAREYFGIWIVNLFLTIMTLGIYSAWAKVRKKRYFYGNTWVAGGNFEYHGNPIAILKGRLIAFAAFVAYTWVGSFAPKSAALILVVLMPAVPWLLLRSFAFNAVNSSYRNLVFHFRGTYRDVAMAIAPFLLIPAATLLGPDLMPGDTPPQAPWRYWPLYVLPLIFLGFYPYIAGRLKLIHVNGMRFGAAQFECRARLGQFYIVYIIAGLLAAALIFGFMFAMVPLFLLGPAAMVAIPLLYLAMGAVVLGFVRAKVANLVLNATRLEGGVRFTSRLRARSLIAIYAVNLAAIFCTVGLAIPWAAVRVARYRAESLTLTTEAGLEDFVAHAAHGVGATGEEMGEMFDVDLSL